MFRLPGQVEVLDDDWLGRARSFLERELPLAKPQPFTKKQLAETD